MEDTEAQIKKIKQNQDNLSEEGVRGQIVELERKCDQNTSELTSMFAKIDDRRRVSLNTCYPFLVQLILTQD